MSRANKKDMGHEKVCDVSVCRKANLIIFGSARYRGLVLIMADQQHHGELQLGIAGA